MRPIWEAFLCDCKPQGGGKIISCMSRFRVVLVEHGYSSVEHERQIISAAGGEFIDAESLPLPEALRLCRDAAHPHRPWTAGL